jgi:hypothetical protein
MTRRACVRAIPREAGVAEESFADCDSRRMGRSRRRREDERLHLISSDAKVRAERKQYNTQEPDNTAALPHRALQLLPRRRFAAKDRALFVQGARRYDRHSWVVSRRELSRLA